MPDYRRYFVPGGTYFFTLVTYQRRRILCREPARRLLREAIQQQLCQRPFDLVAIVLLPDHLHTIWSLPSGDADYPTRWSAIKANFTRSWLKAGGEEGQRSPGKKREERRGVWQPRYFEHTITREQDFERHFDYLHYNPVKHGWARSPAEWPWSTFHKYVNRGVYPANWGRNEITPPGLNEDQLE